MKYLLSGKEMKLLDNKTSDKFKIPPVVLMEQAAMVFVQELLRINTPRKVLVLCGLGNNAGDGIAISRLLNQKNIYSAVYYINNGNSSDLYNLQKEIYFSYEYPVETLLDNFDEYDCIVDAVFGIGLSRTLSDDYQIPIDRANACEAMKISVDIASGISADNGHLFGRPFKADYTICLGFSKLGAYLWPASEYSGKIITAPIGITRDSFSENTIYLKALEYSDLSILPNRKERIHSNKGDYGKLLIIAGSENMAGAAYFAGAAAYKAGTGLVKIFTHQCNRTIIQAKLPEAILSTYGNAIDRNKLLEDITWASTILIGPGLGQSQLALEILKLTLENAKVPLLADADALNLIASNRELLDNRNPNTLIITPHMGEMSRLCSSSISSIQENIIDYARNFADTNKLTCVLKDFRTISCIPFGDTYINLSGNPGMATAGSGDVLAGLMAALLAQGLDSNIATALAVYIHGLAGDYIANETGLRSMTATDIINGITKVFKEID